MVTRRDAHGKHFWLRISEAQFDLVYGRAVLDGVGSQVFVSARLDQAPRKSLNPTIAYLHTLKLSTESTLDPGWTDNVDSLANTNISDLAFVDQLLKFLPRGVGICSQLLIDNGLPVF